MIDDFRLRTFVKVARMGSFTQAAKALGVSQSAVSQTVASLEQAVGEPLLVRSRGEVSLTDSGSAFLTYASRILYWYDRLDAELVRKVNLPATPVPFHLSGDMEARVSVEDGVLMIKIDQQ